MFDLGYWQRFLLGPARSGSPGPLWLSTGLVVKANVCTVCTGDLWAMALPFLPAEQIQ